MIPASAVTYFDTGAGCLSSVRRCSACFMLTPARACCSTSWPRPAVAMEAWMRLWISAARLALSRASVISIWEEAVGATGATGAGGAWGGGLAGWWVEWFPDNN